MVGIMSLNAQILTKSSRKKFDITPVAGTRKARLHRLAFLVPRALFHLLGGRTLSSSPGSGFALRNRVTLPDFSVVSELPAGGWELAISQSVAIQVVINRLVPGLVFFGEGGNYSYCK